MLRTKTVFNIIVFVFIFALVVVGSCSADVLEIIEQNDPRDVDRETIKEIVLHLEDEEVRPEVVEFLKKGDQKDLISVLTEVMGQNQDPDSFLGYEIIKLVSEEGKEALPVLKEGLQSPNPSTRLRTLNVVIDMESEAEKLLPQVTELLIDRKQTAKIQRNAAEALHAIGKDTSEVKRALALGLGADPQTAWAVTKAIKQLALTPDDLMDILIAELDNKELQESVISAIAAHYKHTENPVEFLKKGINDQQDLVRKNTIQAISLIDQQGQGKPEQLSSVLREALDDSSDEIKVEAIYLLGENINIEKNRTELLKIFNDDQQSPEVRKEAAYALEKSKPETRLIEQFVELLIDKDQDYEIREISARYLEKAGPKALPVREDIFANLDLIPEKLKYRISPAIYYSALEEKKVVNQIVDLFEDSDNSIEERLYGLRLLSALGKEVRDLTPAREIYSVIRDSSNHDLRFAAVRALIEIAPESDEIPDLRTVLKKLMADESEELTNLAARHLGFTALSERPEKTRAFPEAEGYGAYTRGGRGGEVYIVDNLQDSGPGSLREAIEAEGPRVIVFTVSGVIHLEEPLEINNPEITIAGQTAPGEGITIYGYPTFVNTDQVIIRHLTFRMGDENELTGDALRGRNLKNVIIDSVSTSWGSEQTATFYRVENFTMQWSIVSEALYDSIHEKGRRGYAGIWGGKGASFHHNLLAHHGSRTPRFSGGGDVHSRNRDDVPDLVDFRNNVIYNWSGYGVHGGEFGLHNMVANYYKPGPATGNGKIAYQIVRPHYDSYWYVADNYLEGYPEITADNWAGGVQPDASVEADSLDKLKAKNPFPYFPVETQTASEAYELVLEKAGANLPARDAIDQRIIEETRTGTAKYGGVAGEHTGIIDSQTDTEGLPFIRRIPAALDSNDDGIPDYWAIQYGFAPDKLEVTGDISQDGYTNIEEYMNGTNPDQVTK